jgi:hypothetical protein
MHSNSCKINEAKAMKHLRLFYQRLIFFDVVKKENQIALHFKNAFCLLFGIKK